jgi:hypothetical protein
MVEPDAVFEVSDGVLADSVAAVVGFELDGVALSVGVGSDRGAVPVFRQVRFPSPSPEPDVRLSTHPALHESR